MAGELDKTEFLFENYMLITRFNIKPFVIQDTLENAFTTTSILIPWPSTTKSYPSKSKKKIENKFG